MISRIKKLVKRFFCIHDYRCMNPETDGIFYLMRCSDCGHRYLLLNEDDE